MGCKLPPALYFVLNVAYIGQLLILTLSVLKHDGLEKIEYNYFM